jgi:hypothetical protein
MSNRKTREIEKYFHEEWRQSVKRNLQKLGIKFDEKAELIAQVSVYCWIIVSHERMRQRLLDKGLISPKTMDLLEACFPEQREPLEDFLKKRRL